MGNNLPQVSVIILNWNGKHWLPGCIQSLYRQTYQDFEVILVDNGSSDGSADWVRSHWPDVRVIALDSNHGFCGGNNIGIREARGEFIVLLNNDTEVEPDWLRALYEHICMDDRIAACDSKILYFDRRDTIWSCGGLYSIAGSVSARGHQQLDSLDFQQPSDVFVAVACSAIYRKSVFDEIGLFDEAYFAGYEDVDWSFRAHLRGYRILNVPSSRVYHKVSATHVNNSDMFVYNGQRNVVATFIKNMPDPLLYRYLPLHLIYTLGSLLYFTKIGRSRSFLRAKWSILKEYESLRKKRQQVQEMRTANPGEIDRLLSRDWFRSKAVKLTG